MAAAAPTFDEWTTQLGNDIKYIELVYQLASTVTDDLLTQENAIVTGLEGNTIPISASLQALVSVRGNVNLILGENAKTFIEARILGVASIIDKVGADVASLLSGLYDYMNDNSFAFLSRIIVRGSWAAAGTNTGDGEVLRVTEDENAHPIENSFSEVISGRVVANAGGSVVNLGATDAGSEIMRFDGTVAGDDELDKELSGRGSGLSADIACVRSGNSIINNPSFADFSGTAAVPTAISSWTVDTIGNVVIDQVNYFVADVSESTPASAKLTGSVVFEQLLTVSGNSYEGDGPYLCQLKWNRGTAISGLLGTGTLTLTQGTVSVAVTLAAQTGWNTLRIPLDSTCWFKNFDNDALTSVKVTWVSTGGTAILIDDLRVVKFENFDNVPTMPLGGATLWRNNDSGTITDTETGAILQRWFWRLFGVYMPAVAPATQVAASGIRTLTYADAGGSDTITANSGSFITDGYKVGMLVTSAGTTSNNLTTGPLVTVTALVLTFGSDTSLTNEGPLSATASLNAAQSVTEPTVTF